MKISLKSDDLWCHYQAYYDKVKNLLGHAVNVIDNIVASMKKNIDYIAYHKFMFYTTMGFLGSSIIEAYNAVIKQAATCANTSMTLDTSGRTIVNINSEREERKKHIILIHITHNVKSH